MNLSVVSSYPPMRILLANHTGAASGAELALMRLVKGLQGEHRIAVACPPRGPLAKAVDLAAVERVSIPSFEASLRLDPIQTPTSMLRLAAAGGALARAARRFDADIIHANTPRAGLIGAVARRLGGPPVVVRAHEHVPQTAVGRSVRSVLAHSSGAILGVSREVARKFNAGLEQPLATHVYNSFDSARFDPARVEAAGIRERLGIAPEAAMLGHIAQITPWKAQDDSIRALALLNRSGLSAHLLVVGKIAFSGKGVRFDNGAYLEGLHALVAELGVEDRVHFLGQRPDVPEILQELDLSLLPSWDEPFANVMLESMSMRTPLVVSEVGGGPELVEDEVSGRLLPPKDPQAWASAIADLLTDRKALARMGRAAREATFRFNDQTHTRAMLDVYEQVLANPERGPEAVAATLHPHPEAAPLRVPGSGRFAPSGERTGARDPLADSPRETTHS